MGDDVAGDGFDRGHEESVNGQSEELGPFDEGYYTSTPDMRDLLLANMVCGRQNESFYFPN